MRKVGPRPAFLSERCINAIFLGGSAGAATSPQYSNSRRNPRTACDVLSGYQCMVAMTRWGAKNRPTQNQEKIRCLFELLLDLPLSSRLFRAHWQPRARRRTGTSRLSTILLAPTLARRLLLRSGGGRTRRPYTVSDVRKKGGLKPAFLLPVFSYTLLTLFSLI
jgi:hypothetical protein